jgi:hypothetical protein
VAESYRVTDSCDHSVKHRSAFFLRLIFSFRPISSFKHEICMQLVDVKNCKIPLNRLRKSRDESTQFRLLALPNLVIFLHPSMSVMVCGRVEDSNIVSPCLSHPGGEIADCLSWFLPKREENRQALWSTCPCRVKPVQNGSFPRKISFSEVSQFYLSAI